MRLVLTGDLDEFLPLREGSYPRIPDEKHNGIDYSKERAIVPRRIPVSYTHLNHAVLYSSYIGFVIIFYILS